MMRLVAIVAVAVTGLIAPAATAGSPCSSPDGARRLPEGPVPVGFSQADFGIVRGACPRSELGLALDGRAIVESENFYGNLYGGTRLDASARLLPSLELFASVEPVVFHQVIQSLKATYIGLGETSVGGTLLAFGRERFALSVTTRLDLPTSVGYHKNAWPIGVEAGALMLLEPIDELRFHGGLLGGMRTAFTKADAGKSAAVVGNAGVDVVIVPQWFSAVVDLHAQALERGGLDLLAVGVGLRFVIFEVGLEAGANIPIAGDERNALAAVLRAAYRFE
jgi:hypothetical protein